MQAARRNQIHAIKQGGIRSVGSHAGIGFSSFKQEYQNDTVTDAGGTPASEGTITIAAGREVAAKGNMEAILIETLIRVQPKMGLCIRNKIRYA